MAPSTATVTHKPKVRSEEAWVYVSCQVTGCPITASMMKMNGSRENKAIKAQAVRDWRTTHIRRGLQVEAVS